MFGNEMWREECIAVSRTEFRTNVFIFQDLGHQAESICFGTKSHTKILRSRDNNNVHLIQIIAFVQLLVTLDICNCVNL